MKFFHKLQILFLSIVVLLSVIITMLLIYPDQLQPKEPEIFYCGNALRANGENHVAGERLFKDNCKSCHRIHQDAVGPALSGVTKRRSKEWLYAFIEDPQAMIKKRDTAAVNLYMKYNKFEMMSFKTLSTADIDSILVYIELSDL